MREAAKTRANLDGGWPTSEESSPTPDSEIGSGLSKGELGLRLRYEIRREFAPYIGVAYERAFGDTADFVRAHGEDAESTRFIVGLRAWF